MTVKFGVDRNIFDIFDIVALLGAFYLFKTTPYQVVTYNVT